MNCVLYNQEPFALVQNMSSYFKCNPPDCRIISQDNSEHMIHKELLYQTKFLCEMVRSVDSENSNIDILCPDFTKQEIQILVRFLYTGEISCQDQIVASEVSSILTKLFGFPTIYQCSTTSIQDSNFVSLSGQNVSRKKQPLDLGSNLKLDFAEETYKTEYEEDLINNLKKEHKLEHVEQEYDPLTIKIAKKEVDTVHEGKKLYPCLLCGLAFKSIQGRGKHVLLVHGPGGIVYKCLLCNIVVKKIKKSLIAHIKTIHEIQEPKVTEHFIPEKSEFVPEQDGLDLKKYACLVCDKKLKNRRCQLEHMKDLHKKACHFCGSIFQTAKQKTKHISESHSNSIKPCTICKIKFANRTKLEYHMFLVHKQTETVHLCSLCGKKCANSKALKSHVTSCQRSEPKRNKLECDICKEKFETLKLRIKHIDLKHKEVKLHECSLCESKFLSERTYSKHYQFVHEKTISNLCSLCGKNYSSKFLLQAHISGTHEGKKKPRKQCKMCDKSFTWIKHLKEHVESVHEGKKHKCSICDEEFTSKSKFDSHIAINHDEAKLLKCTICDAKYVSKSGLKNHIFFVHEKNSGHQCPHCDQKHPTESTLKNHIALRHSQTRYKCEHCDKTYKLETTLKMHIGIAHEGKKPPEFFCPHCGKSFGSTTGVNRHIEAVHEKKRPHSCHLCDLAFAQKGQLKTHIKGKHRI